MLDRSYGTIFRTKNKLYQVPAHSSELTIVLDEKFIENPPILFQLSRLEKDAQNKIKPFNIHYKNRNRSQDFSVCQCTTIFSLNVLLFEFLYYEHVVCRREGYKSSNALYLLDINMFRYSETRTDTTIQAAQYTHGGRRRGTHLQASTYASPPCSPLPPTLTSAAGLKAAGRQSRARPGPVNGLRWSAA